MVLSCSSTRQIQEQTFNCTQTKINIPRVVHTANAKLHYPFMHINGFKNCEVLPTKNLKTADGSWAHKARFNATYAASYTGKVLFECFGIWTETIRFKGYHRPVLVWRDLKLFEDSHQKFSVYAFGHEDSNGRYKKNELFTIYSEVAVITDRGDDALHKRSPFRKKVLTYFFDGIAKINDCNKFYAYYWDLK